MVSIDITRSLQLSQRAEKCAIAEHFDVLTEVQAMAVALDESFGFFYRLL